MDLQRVSTLPLVTLLLVSLAGCEKKAEHIVRAPDVTIPQLPPVPQASRKQFTPSDIQLEAPKSHGGFRSFAFSPDGKLVLGGTGVATVEAMGTSSTFGGEVILWNAHSGRIVKSLGAHGATVDWVAFAKNGELAVSASEDNGVIMVWSVTTGGNIARLDADGLGLESDATAGGRMFSSVNVSSNGRLLTVVGAKPHTVSNRSLSRSTPFLVFDLESKEIAWRLDGPDIRGFAISPDDQLVALQIHEMEWSSKEGRPIGKTTRETVELRRLESGEVVGEIEQAKGFTHLAFLDGETLVGLNSKELVRWSAKDGALLGRQSIKGNDFAREFRFSRDKDDLYLAIYRSTERVEVWDLTKGEIEHCLTTKFPNSIWNPSFSPTLDRMVCSGGPGPGPLIVDLTALPAEGEDIAAKR